MFAGHSIQEHDQCCLLLNEFDGANNFYRKFEAQKILDELATKFHNTYIVGIFATSDHSHETSIIKNPCLPE